MTRLEDEDEDANLPVVLVLAVSENGVIGRGNALPWDLPDDLSIEVIIDKIEVTTAS